MAAQRFAVVETDSPMLWRSQNGLSKVQQGFTEVKTDPPKPYKVVVRFAKVKRDSTKLFNESTQFAEGERESAKLYKDATPFAEVITDSPMH